VRLHGVPAEAVARQHDHRKGGQGFTPTTSRST
jgi:hypothetical protein